MSPHKFVWCGEVQSGNFSLTTKLYAIVWLIVVCSATAWSQMGSQPIELYEGQKVSAVEIAGRPGYDHSWERLLVQRAGQPFSQNAVQSSVDALRKIQGVTGVNLQVHACDALNLLECVNAGLNGVLREWLPGALYQQPLP